MSHSCELRSWRIEDLTITLGGALPIPSIISPCIETAGQSYVLMMVVISGAPKVAPLASVLDVA